MGAGVGGTQLEADANGEKEAGAEAEDTEAGAVTGKRARGSESPLQLAASCGSSCRNLTQSFKLRNKMSLSHNRLTSGRSAPKAEPESPPL